MTVSMTFVRTLGQFSVSEIIISFIVLNMDVTQEAVKKRPMFSVCFIQSLGSC